MPNKHNSDRANLGEQTDLSSTNVEQEDRSMSAGSRDDRMAGSEGIEDPAMERSHRETMESSPSERSGRASSRDMARVNKSTRKSRESDSRESNTDESEFENPSI